MAAPTTDEATAESTTPKRTRTPKAASSNGKSGPRAMTQEHKNALKLGREQGRIVGDYLDALLSQKPRRGRPVTVDTVKAKIEKINAELETASGVDRLKNIQKRMDLQKDLRGLEDSTEIETLQEAFVKVAKEYSDRSGMTYAAFKEYGVPTIVLKEAGISR